MAREKPGFSRRLEQWAENELMQEFEAVMMVQDENELGIASPKQKFTWSKLNNRFNRFLAHQVIWWYRLRHKKLSIEMLMNIVSPTNGREKYKKIIFGLISLILLVALAWGVYLRFIKGYPWAEWTGFGEYSGQLTIDQRAKTLWDWMELLIIPVVLAIAAFWLNRSENDRRSKLEEQRLHAQRENETDRYREAALQTYFDKMTELLLDKELLLSEEGDGTRRVAEARSISTIEQLDGKRKSMLLRFLKDTGLIDVQNPIISLNGANFRKLETVGLSLNGVDLSGADFRLSNISYCDFNGAKLYKTMFSGSSLGQVTFIESDLRDADFSETVLDYVKMDDADMRGTVFIGFGNVRTISDILQGPSSDKMIHPISVHNAIYNHATQWPHGFDPDKDGATNDGSY